MPKNFLNQVNALIKQKQNIPEQEYIKKMKVLKKEIKADILKSNNATPQEKALIDLMFSNKAN